MKALTSLLNELEEVREEMSEAGSEKNDMRRMKEILRQAQVAASHMARTYEDMRSARRDEGKRRRILTRGEAPLTTEAVGAAAKTADDETKCVGCRRIGHGVITCPCRRVCRLYDA